ncbi:MAG: indolepyruvate ferredoxin oxidoreductase subunit alpha [Candidatus Thermoplasmatota archaeon]|nr:indolepyruvate ferredoxin oxidoreductase subunit alpha [Candidatus Thermoplasmatota archaeon]
MHPILEDEPGKKMLALGNEAITRAAIEAGVTVAATYPGTPSSEIGNTMHKVAKEAGIYFEFSTNEKVAFETAAAAAVAGVRAFSFMKHVGLNVAADAFMTLAYTGVRAGYVVLTADDPSCHSSQNEQDNRFFAKMSGVPMVEPSSPEEARQMMHYAFELSERFQMPVLFRTTTRMNHVRGIIELGKIRKPSGRVHFEKDPGRFVTVPANARKRHLSLLEIIPRMQNESEVSPFNRVIVPEKKNTIGSLKLGIITSGVSYNYVLEVLNNIELGVEARVLKLGMTSPLPDDMISEFSSECDLILTVEEGEMYLEEYVKAVLKERDVPTVVLGKRDGHFPRPMEYNPDIVARGIVSALEGEGMKIDLPVKEAIDWETLPEPPRPPVLCAGCPHRATFLAVRRATKGKAVYPNDIGCYTLGIQPPQSTGDLLICMGSSVGSAGGLSRVVDEPVISFIGDSTFFHSGIAPLVNAVHNKHRFVLNIMDNATTAMTGHQPHPGLPVDGMGDEAPAISIEKVCKGVGVEFVKTVNPLNVKETQKAFEEALAHEGVSVVITRSPCALKLERELRKRNIVRTKYQVYQDKCTRCDTCTRIFACPAFYKIGDEHYIDPDLCWSCGVCEQVCPFGAMGPVREEKGGE